GLEAESRAPRRARGATSGADGGRATPLVAVWPARLAVRRALLVAGLARAEAPRRRSTRRSDPPIFGGAPDRLDRGCDDDAERAGIHRDLTARDHPRGT